MATENSPLLKGIRSDIIMDPTSDVPGFIASELEQDELLLNQTYLDNHDIETDNEDMEVLPRKQVIIIIMSMYVGVFLSALDSTIVTTLSGKIASEFNSLPKLSWIATAYLVASATFQPLYGKLSDIFGRRALLLFCNVLFTIGCLICSISSNINILILGRFISGAGGGGLNSLASICCSDLISLRQRGIVQGCLNVAFGVGTAIGGYVGGLFADNEDLGGWRGAFLIQVPISLISTFLIHTKLILPKGSSGLGVKSNYIKTKLNLIDWYGSISLIISLLLFLTTTSISGSKNFEYDSLNFFFLVLLTIISFAIFALIELNVKNPTLPLSFLKIPTVLGVSTSNFFSTMSFFTVVFIVPIYFTVIFDLNSVEIGKRISPNFLSIIIGSLGSGIYIKVTGRYKKLLLSSCFFIIFGNYRILTMNSSYSTFEQYILLLTPGFGGSILITITLLALIAAVPHEHQASTTSISYLFRSCGSTLGVSIGSEIFNKSLKVYLKEEIFKYLNEGYTEIELNDIYYKSLHSSEYVRTEAPKFIQNTLIFCYDKSAKNSFMFAFGAAILTFLGTLFIKEYKLHTSVKR